MMMGINTMRFGLMAVFAVSGSMVFLVHQVHKRILSNFMEKFEFEMGGILHPHGQNKLRGCCEKNQAKKKVRFAKRVLELPLENKSYRRKVTRAKGVKAEDVMEKNIQNWRRGPKIENVMPPNRAVLYKGIMKYKKGRFRF